MPLKSLDIGDSSASTLETHIVASGDVTPWIRIHGLIGVQITGTATAVGLQIERSTRDPVAEVANTAPAGDVITGNPATGMQALSYDEPGVAWWRGRCTALVGGVCDVVLNGVGGR